MHTIVLWIEALMAVGLVAGAVIARQRRFTAHAWLQGSIVAGNLLVIAAVMVPALYRYLGPHALETPIVLVHAFFGTAAELLGLYVVLSAGLGWLHPRFRFTNYKPWMRVTLATWLVAFGLGAWTDQTLNGGQAPPPPPPPPPASAPQSAPPSAPQPATPSVPRITVKNFGFEPSELTIAVGDEVEWMDEGGRHTVQADNGSFKSPILTAGGTFRHRFDKAGVYRYFCEFHGSKGGHDMAGVVNVK